MRSLPHRLYATGLVLTLALGVPAAAWAGNGGIAPGSTLSDPSQTGGVSPTLPLPPPPPAPAPAPAPPPTGPVALVGARAQAPANAPRVIQLAVRAGNRLQNKPYRFGGGHASFRDTAYDCSGAVSYVLHVAGLLASPLDSSGLAKWGEPGPGAWITIYANNTHAFMYVGGLRLDTSGPGPSGPRWRTLPRSLRGFTVRHPLGL